MPLERFPLPLLLSLLAWAAVGIGMTLGRDHGGRAKARLDPRARLGLVLQALAMALAFVARRPLDHPAVAERVLRWLGAGLAWSAAWLAIVAARRLGPQWSLDARLLPEHRLVRQGPYRHVRHPIYLAVSGLLVGLGLNLTAWLPLAGSVALYLLGTWLRIDAEEGLLRERFGAEHARYAAEVPALVPLRRP
jgi:protein-S-isoprenylcysteine O-methyltransferase Ste14